MSNFDVRYFCLLIVVVTGILVGNVTGVVSTPCDDADDYECVM